MLSLSLFKTKTLESFASSRQDTLLQISESVTSYTSKIELLSESYAEIDYIKEQAAISSEHIDIGSFRSSIEEIQTQIDESFFFPEISYELQIFCDNGLSYSSDEGHLETLLALPKTLWFYHAMKEHDDSLWQSNILFKDEAGKTNVISLVKFIKDEQGNNHGAVLINLNERQLYEIYSQIIGFQSTIYLVDNNGQIASHPILSMVGRFFYDMKIFNAFFAENNWAQITKSGEEYLFSKFTSADNPWIVVEEIPLSMITDPLEQVTATIYLVTILLLLFSVIIALLLSKRVSKPFERLERSMERAGEGDLSITFEKSGCFESFNMADSSQQFVSQIQGLIDELKITESEKRVSELEFLQMQINPHFMYNTLFTIRCMVDIGLKDDACEMIERFSHMLKKVLKISTPMITILDNIDYLEDYGFIMKQRFGSLKLDYEIEEGIEQEEILKFILQPLVENSVYHGFADSEMASSRILITFSSLGTELIEIHVIDNGCGMSEEQISKIIEASEPKGGDHIGLINVKTKLELYYEGRASIQITSQQGEGTDICIIVPKVED